MRLLSSRHVAAALLATALVAPVAPGAAAARPAPTPTASTVAGTPPALEPMPDARRWRAEVRQALRGSTPALRARVARAVPGERLAIVLDIDNTAMETYYRRGYPTRRVLRLAAEARSLGVAVLFVTGRAGDWAAVSSQRLALAGYPVDGLCSRLLDEALATSKQRCRAEFVQAGYTLVFNVGNRPTDFERAESGGEGYERGWKLPDYDLRLG